MYAFTAHYGLDAPPRGILTTCGSLVDAQAAADVEAAKHGDPLAVVFERYAPAIQYACSCGFTWRRDANARMIPCPHAEAGESDHHGDHHVEPTHYCCQNGRLLVLGHTIAEDGRCLPVVEVVAWHETQEQVSVLSLPYSLGPLVVAWAELLGPGVEAESIIKNAATDLLYASECDPLIVVSVAPALDGYFCCARPVPDGMPVPEPWASGIMKETGS